MNVARLRGERTFPIMSRPGAAAHPTRIPWSIADLAYSVYLSRYGTHQTLERIAERGGFDPTEMDNLLPDWRHRCGAVGQAKAEVERLKAIEETLHQTCDNLDGQRLQAVDEVVQLREELLASCHDHALDMESWVRATAEMHARELAGYRVREAEVDRLRRIEDEAQTEVSRLIAEVERLKLGWQQAERDKNTHFDQSCKNLARAEQAEARLAEVVEALQALVDHQGIVHQAAAKGDR